MIKKSLWAVALLVATSLPVAAHACAGCNIKFNGVSENGIRFNGARLNGITWNGLRLNGLVFNGFRMNGAAFNGIKLNGFTLNGRTFNERGLDGTGALVAETRPAAGETAWSAIPLDAVRVRLPLAR